MNYLQINEYLNHYWDENGYEELIKGLLSFELDEKDEAILNKLYEYYAIYDNCSFLSEQLIDKYEEIVKGSEE